MKIQLNPANTVKTVAQTKPGDVFCIVSPKSLQTQAMEGLIYIRIEDIDVYFKALELATGKVVPLSGAAPIVLLDATLTLSVK